MNVWALFILSLFVGKSIYFENRRYKFHVPNFNTFLTEKGDFTIFTCNNSNVTYIVKEVQKERYNEFS
ncbi:hypothetical protein B4080_3230 [Bacillus cereus]|nr:hypothetical protein B4080_3230 [Bacillus cereus]